MKKLLILPFFFALFFALFFVAGQLFVADQAEAFPDGRQAQCAWYKSKAMAAGRRGDKNSSEKYWQMYRDCMRGRID